MDFHGLVLVNFHTARVRVYAALLIFFVNMRDLILAHRKADCRAVTGGSDLVPFVLFNENNIALLHQKFFALDFPNPLPLDDIPPLIPVVMMVKTVPLARKLRDQCGAIVFGIN